ncbi:hypothetical protein BJX70DRAFT_395324 [Aspergillus crustosus]
MSDPFSGLIAYYGPWRSYDDEINDFTTRLEGLLNTLKVLEGFISRRTNQTFPTISISDWSRHI